MLEDVSIEEVWEAYYDCRKRKRNTEASVAFELNEAQNIVKLWREVNDRTYEIGYSNAFCVTRPKAREVFAADFRDRIVHHLLMSRIGQLIEESFIDDTYNCRKGKGTLYGVKRILEKTIRLQDCWILKCDIKGFFMSIDKKILWEKLRQFIIDRYTEENKEFVLWIAEKITMHDASKKCIKKGDLTLWDKLSKDKSLFTNKENCGLAIGNLTSQILANFYLSFFDKWITSIEGIEYGRYVDDFIVVSKDKRLLLELIPKIRVWLDENLRVELHPDKIYLQHVTKGVMFTGTQIKNGRLYTGNRTVYNAFKVVEEYNRMAKIDIRAVEDNIEKFVQRMNSFLGFLKQSQSYSIRWRIWNEITDDVKKYIYMTDRMCVIRVRKRYKRINKLIKRYGNHSITR